MCQRDYTLLAARGTSNHALTPGTAQITSSAIPRRPENLLRCKSTYFLLRAICDGIRKKLIVVTSAHTATNQKNRFTFGSGFMAR